LTRSAFYRDESTPPCTSATGLNVRCLTAAMITLPGSHATINFLSLSVVALSIKKLILYVGVYRRIGLLIHHRSWHDYVKCDMINDQLGRCWITYFPSSEWYYLFNHLRLL